MSDLADQIDALLALNGKGAVSHPVPGLAVELLTKAAGALRATPVPAPAPAPVPVPVTIAPEVAELQAALIAWVNVAEMLAGEPGMDAHFHDVADATLDVVTRARAALSKPGEQG